MHRIRIGLVVFLITFGAALNANAVTVEWSDLTGSPYTVASTLTTDSTVLTVDALTPFTFFQTFSLLSIEATAAYLNQKALPSQRKISTQSFALSEPASVTLLGVGILVVGFVCRRAFRRR